MTPHRIAVLLAVALLAAPCRPAAAQEVDAPPAKRVARPAKGHARATARKAAKPVSAEAGRSPLLGPEPAEEDRAASLERRRRAFFAKPEDVDPAPDGTPPRPGVTLGGSNGLTPGMTFGF